MILTHAHRFARVLILLCSVGAAAPASALTYLVGAGAVPSVCDMNSLQAAIDAAQNNPGVDFIRVANDQAYSALGLTVGQQDLTITGGYESCGAALPPGALPTGSTILSGSGTSGKPVIDITGSGVRVFDRFQIRNGTNTNGSGTGCGGGIRIVGRGEIRLTNVGISQNSANLGGGVCFSGTGTPALLTLGSDTSVSANIAISGDGGGIHLSGSARLNATQDRTLIALNSATSGDGGGLYVQTPARADIGSPGAGSTGVLYGNTAERGGAVAVVSEEGINDVESCTRLFSTDATRPIRVHGNRALGVGGAFFMRTNNDAGGYAIASMSVHDARIDDNSAPNGPVAYLSGDSVLGQEFGAELQFNRELPSFKCDDTIASLGRVACTNRAECNRIEGNRARDGNNVPTNGNVFELIDNSQVDIIDMVVTGNRGTRLISWSSSDLGSAFLQRCALVGNTVTQEIFRAFNDGVFDIRDCTIGGNDIGGTSVLRFDTGNDYGSYTNLLVEQPGKTTIVHPNIDSPNNSNEWIVATDVSGFAPDPTVLPGRARFIDPARGDYNLRIGSQAVDYAPVVAGADVDLAGRPRDVDLGEAHANTRARDLGGYERQLNDEWLLNGDFVGNLNQWGNADPTHVVWDGAFNAPNSVGGAVVYSVPAENVGPTERRLVLSQCFNVPSSGVYQIIGMAQAPGGSEITRDYPLISYQLRYDSDDCSGTAAASGQAFFGRSSTTWQPLAQALLVNVDPAQWSWNTTIEVHLEAAQNQQSPTATGLNARFDEIEIIRQSSVLFRDSFESL